MTLLRDGRPPSGKGRVNTYFDVCRRLHIPAQTDYPEVFLCTPVTQIPPANPCPSAPDHDEDRRYPIRTVADTMSDHSHVPNQSRLSGAAKISGRKCPKISTGTAKLRTGTGQHASVFERGFKGKGSVRGGGVILVSGRIARLLLEA